MNFPEVDDYYIFQYQVQNHSKSQYANEHNPLFIS